MRIMLSGATLLAQSSIRMLTAVAELTTGPKHVAPAIGQSTIPRFSRKPVLTTTLTHMMTKNQPLLAVEAMVVFLLITKSFSVDV